MVGQGEHDIVYFVKPDKRNEELRYSLRSAEENFPHRKVWIYGGCPESIFPDSYVCCRQNAASSRWMRVRDMVAKACANDEISKSFWLFNDDFFILQPINDNAPVFYDGTLADKIRATNLARGGRSNDWTRRLQALEKTLKKHGKPTLNYAVHAPMLIDRSRALEVISLFPEEPMFRALYGNWYELAKGNGINSHDYKLTRLRTNGLSDIVKSVPCISTSDESFLRGDVGRWLRNRFNEKSRFEK